MFTIQRQTRVRKVRTERSATLKTMRIVIAVEQMSYRLESQEQTLFETHAQCGRDNRFNCPFGAYQKKKVIGTVIFKQNWSDKLSSKTRKGTSEFRGETPIKWRTFGCLFHKISWEELWRQWIKVSYITFWLKLAAAKQRLNRKCEGQLHPINKNLYLHLWHDFLHTVWSWLLFLWQCYGQSRLDTLGLYKSLSSGGHPQE